MFTLSSSYVFQIFFYVGASDVLGGGQQVSISILAKIR